MSDPRLGRLLRHDPRSRNYPAKTADTLRTVWHRRYGRPLDQGQLGSCTGNAAITCLMTKPLHRSGRVLHEPDAVAVYSLATTLDDVKGSYPPDDTGSSGLAAAQACVRKGYTTGYDHAFGLDHALAALVLSPVMVGTNWYDSMFNPAPDGTLSISGKVAGGHEYALTGIDVHRQRVRVSNSWGSSWGVRGNAWLSFTDLGRLLEEQGDVTVLR